MQVTARLSATTERPLLRLLTIGVNRDQHDATFEFPPPSFVPISALMTDAAMRAPPASGGGAATAAAAPVGDGRGTEVRETPFLSHFYANTDQSTKTGSGQP
jgi:hypothetical protein